MQNKILKHVLFHDNNASAALYNPLRNMSGLGVAEMETPPPPRTLDLGSEAWHGTVNLTVPLPVTAADGGSALGAAFRAAGQENGGDAHHE